MIRLNLHDVIVALSTSLDFVGVDEVQHGKRVGHMARTIGLALGWSRARCRRLLHAGMLHDFGVSQVREPRTLNASLEWEGAEGHCVRGADYLAACPALAHFAEVVRYHHTRWAVLEQVQGLSAQSRLDANLVHLVDRVDVLFAPYLRDGDLNRDIVWRHGEIVARLQALDDGMFAPELVAAFVEVAATDAFWFSMDPDYLDEEIDAIGRELRPRSLDVHEMRALALLISRVVDAKSHYTDDHSRRVAAICRHLAAEMGRDGEALMMIELAGLLHDLGKLRVPDEIIEKPGALTCDERAYIARHSYDTYRFLDRIFPGTPIPRWAGMHHENLLGMGYPFRSRAEEIDLESRIVSVADIFQALLQDRPYRARMSDDEVLDRLDCLVREGRLDAGVVSVLVREREVCARLAVSELPHAAS